MNIVIYARYSSHSQNEQSIEGQLEVCRAYAKQNKYKVICEYIDRATTGTNDDRPEFLKMINDSNKKSFQGILVYQLDRFARNRYDSATYKHALKKNGVRVLSAKENISDDASGILVESVLEGMAEYYSAELSEKVMRGMRINAENCYYNGSAVPLGYKLVEVDSNFTDSTGKIIKKKKFAIDENTAPVVKEIFNMYINGTLMADIIKYLNSKGIKTSKNNDFNKNSIRRILQNKKYIGIYIYQNIEVADGVPKIIDVETFNKVQEMLQKNKKAPSRAKAKREYLLTTKLFCGYCKELMSGYSGTSKSGKLHSYYLCNNHRKKLCDKKIIKKEYIENIVVKYARSIFTDDNIEEIAQKVVDLANKEKDTSTIKRLYKLLKDNERQKQNLFDSLKICSIDSVRLSIFEEINKMEIEHIRLKDEIAIQESPSIKLTIPQVKFFLLHLRNRNINDIKYKKILINTLIHKIYLYDDELTIIFNAQDNPCEKNIPLIEDLECSFLGTTGTPKYWYD